MELIREMGTPAYRKLLRSIGLLRSQWATLTNEAGTKTKKAHPVSQDELDIEGRKNQTLSLTYLITQLTRDGIGTFYGVRISAGLPRLQRAITLRLSG